MSTSRCPPPAPPSHYALAAFIACALSVVLLPACARPLLSPNDERTPFDRYDEVRSQQAPQYIENEYGRRESNLRGRLTPKD